MQQPLEIHVPVSKEFAAILTPAALEFVAALVQKFAPQRDKLLQRRKEIQTQIDNGVFPDFLKETEGVRQSSWRVAPFPKDLEDRRVEITGPVERKMVINALNSGAKVFMADFEDSNAPTWENNLQGQINLRDAVNRTIEYTSPEGKHYKLNEKIATLMVRPRGWHLNESRVTLGGKPIPGGLFDFGLYFFHNAKNLLKNGTGPYFYLPKMESHLEARLWNDVFVFAQNALALKQGTIRATVLIETILAAFEMDEILYEQREHSAGLNCGRWDYIFSFIKKFRAHKEFVLPDRAQVTMESHFLKSYVDLLIQTCHKRGAHAMGGMAAQIPIKNDPVANEKAIQKVVADKERESKAGHDGTWVAHPGLVPVATKVFDEKMPQANQLKNLRSEVRVSQKDLLQVPAGTITEGGLRININVGIQYLASWLCGAGCVPINHLMEDAATAEISRTQVWQWVRHHAKTEDGQPITAERACKTTKEELARIKEKIGDKSFDVGRFTLAGELFDKMMTDTICADFLTLIAYEHL